MAIGSNSLASNHICAAVSFMGLAISLYAFYVEHNLDNNINYQPLCDIAYYISCSKAFRSRFAEGLGIASAIFGADHKLTQFLGKEAIADIIGIREFSINIPIFCSHLLAYHLRSLCIHLHH
ncbi:Vitamin K epoxide reductase complex subunit 1-like protein [Dirofilaria immitis]|nr:hypothetical protein [Dirofilaria immitis]